MQVRDVIAYLQTLNQDAEFVTPTKDHTFRFVRKYHFSEGKAMEFGDDVLHEGGPADYPGDDGDVVDIVVLS